MTIEISKLPNGLTVATDHMASIETCSVGVWVKVGARDESASQNGIAHLLEHMAFKGTATRSAFDIAREIEDVGGFINAYTGRECTAYYARVLPNAVELAVELLADILRNSLFDAEELDRERSVILQEIGQAHDMPDDIIFDHFQEAAYPGQGVGRPVLGQRKVIERVTRDDLLGYLARNYDPSRMVVCAAGKIEHSALVKIAGRAFGDFDNQTDELLHTADYEGGEFIEARQGLEQVHLVLGLQGSSAFAPDFSTASVLSTLFGGSMSSRLFQEVREKRGLVYSVQSFLSSLTDTGIFGVYAGTGEEELSELIPVLVQCFKSLNDGISAEEINRAKAQHSASLLMGRESTTGRCESLAQYALGLIPEIDPAALLAGVNAVTETDLRDYAGQMLSTPLTVAAIGPVKSLPKAKAIQAALQR